MYFIREKTIQLIDFFIHESIKNKFNIEGIQFLYKVRLLVAISICALLFVSINTLFEISRIKDPVELLVVVSDVIIVTIVILWTKVSSNPLKVIPLACYLLLANILYFSTPDKSFKSFAPVWLPFIIIMTLIVSRKIHAYIVFTISLIFTLAMSLTSNFYDVTVMEKIFENYIELACILTLTFFLVFYNSNVNQRIIELIAKYKDAIIAERTHTLSGAKMNAITKIAGGMAHEFNNPLAIVLGYAYKIKTLAESNELTLEQATHISNRIEDTVERISQLTSALQSIGNTTTKKEQFSKIKLIEVIKKSIHIAKSKSNKARVVFDSQDDSLVIECVQGQLVQCLVNVIDNAIEAAPDEANSWIRIYNEQNEDEDYTTIYIENSGPRLDPNIFPKICEPFYSTKSGASKVGMGLPIAESIARLHQGFLFMPPEGVFTVFALKLPLNQPESLQSSRGSAH